MVDLKTKQLQKPLRLVYKLIASQWLYDLTPVGYSLTRPLLSRWWSGTLQGSTDLALLSHTHPHTVPLCLLLSLPSLIHWMIGFPITPKLFNQNHSGTDIMTHCRLHFNNTYLHKTGSSIYTLCFPNYGVYSENEAHKRLNGRSSQKYILIPSYRL